MASDAGSRQSTALLRGVVLVALCATTVGTWYAWTHRYRVDAVLDGDTLAVNWRGQRLLVQLAGADAPELHKTAAGEPMARQAQSYLRQLVQDRVVWVEAEDPGAPWDQKQRLLAWVTVDGVDVSGALIDAGLARFSGAAEGPQRDRLLSIEAEARRAHRGMWAIDLPDQPRPSARDAAWREEMKAIDEHAHRKAH